MGAVPAPVLPSDLDGCHVLALPVGADVRGLAGAWFVDASWEIPPAPPRQGRLRLSRTATLTGPWRLPAARPGEDDLPERDLDLYGLTRGESDPLVLGWASAAARRAAGAVVSADRAQVLAPDAAAAADLTLWTGTVLTATDLVAVARPHLAGARTEQAMALPGGRSGGPPAYTVTARFQYDGALTLTAQPRDAVPVAVAGLAWGEHGPWTYHVAWVPPDPSELTAALPSRQHLIARSRVVPVVARAVRALALAAGGVVVDDGGFPVRDDELAQRGATL